MAEYATVKQRLSTLESEWFALTDVIESLEADTPPEPKAAKKPRRQHKA